MQFPYSFWTQQNQITGIITASNSGLIPHMTSNTAPYGLAFASTFIAGHDAWNAFNSSAWAPSTINSAPQWVGYKFISPVIVTGYTAIISLQQIWILEASNNDINYTPLLSGLNLNQSNIGTVPFNSNSYIYYRWRSITNNSIFPAVGYWQLYGFKL